MKQTIAFGMAVVMSASINFGDIVNQAATIEEYHNQPIRLTMSNSKGIKKITVNGKKIKIKKNTKKVVYVIKKQGKYVIKLTNKKNRTIKKIVYLDKTAPIISGVEDGITYDRAVTIYVSDNFKVQSATLNGTKFNKKYTISSEGKYVVIVTDCAGNKKSITFTVKFANTSNPSNDYGSGSSGSDASSANNQSVTEEPKAKSTVTPKATPILTATPIVTKTSTPEVTPTATLVVTKTPIPEVTPTATPVVTKSPTPVVTPTATAIVKEHAWKEVNRFDATCTEDGVIKYVCTDCGEEKFETIKAVGHHVYTDKTVDISAATWTEDATYSRVCDNCGEVEDEVRIREWSHTDQIPPRIWSDVFYKDTDDYIGDYQKDLWYTVITKDIDVTKNDGKKCVMSFGNPQNIMNTFDTGNHPYASVSIAFDETLDKGCGIKNVQVVMNSYLESEAATFTTESEYQKMCRYYENYKTTGKMAETAFNPEYTMNNVKLKFSRNEGFAQYFYVLVEDFAGNVSIKRSLRIF